MPKSADIERVGRSLARPQARRRQVKIVVVKSVHRQDGCAAGSIRVEPFDERLRQSRFPGTRGASERNDNATADSAVAEFMLEMLKRDHSARQGGFLPNSKLRVTVGDCALPVLRFMRGLSRAFVYMSAYSAISRLPTRRFPKDAHIVATFRRRPGRSVGRRRRSNLAGSVGFRDHLFLPSEPTDDVRHQFPVERPCEKILESQCGPMSVAQATVRPRPWSRNGKEQQGAASRRRDGGMSQEAWMNRHSWNPACSSRGLAAKGPPHL